MSEFDKWYDSYPEKAPYMASMRDAFRAAYDAGYLAARCHWNRVATENSDNTDSHQNKADS
jgi:hypothetical protein